MLRADLRNADLTSADLSGADLTSADLTWADLTSANLSGADLYNGSYDESGANLINAKGVTHDELAVMKHLESATMPNGQKYEDWLKTDEGKRYEDFLRKQYEYFNGVKGVEEDGENSSPS